MSISDRILTRVFAKRHMRQDLERLRETVGVKNRLIAQMQESSRQAQESSRQAQESSRQAQERLRQAHEQALRREEELKELRSVRQSGQIKDKLWAQQLDDLRVQLAEALDSRPLPSLSGENAPMFFVVGHDKSGTTWLKNMLDSHPEVLCKGEGRFFERSFRQAVELEDLQEERLKTLQPTSLYGALSSCESLRTWISRSVWTEGEDPEGHLLRLNRLAVNYFLTDSLLKSGKKIVGDKTPSAYAEYLSEISTGLPEARVIHIIRDGRDVAVSMMHHMWNYARDTKGFYYLEPEEIERREAYRVDSQAALAEGLFVGKRLKTIAQAWREQAGKAAEHGPALLGKNYAEVRYEDLLEKPEEGLGKLLQFIGASAGEEVVARIVQENRFEKWAEGRRKGQEESAAFYRKGVAGDWRNVFTEEDKRIFKEAAGDLLIDFGYEKDDDW